MNLVADQGKNIIIGIKGYNHLDGAAGADTLIGREYGDDLYGSAGRDLLLGMAGDGRLFGGGQSASLYGDNGHDILLGGNGRDILDGGKGRDVLEGGTHADVFIFKKGYEKDIIVDFEDDKDTISFATDLWFGTKTVQNVINRIATAVDGDIVFDFGSHELTVKGFTNLAELKDDITFI